MCARGDCLREFAVSEGWEGGAMIFSAKLQKTPWSVNIRPVSELEEKVYIATIYAIAALPLLLSICLIIWGA
jgi:hypothetical protein